MNKRFEELVDKMQPWLQELLEKEPIAIREIGKGPEKVPEQGVYVFFERDKAIYVGRSNHLKKRLKQHSQESSKRSATLAIKMAKREMSKRGMSTLQNEEGKTLTVNQLFRNEAFKKEFEAAKDRIARMEIRWVEIKDQQIEQAMSEIKDQIEQAMFEIYVHLELGTEFNDFKTT